jgi:hypothetical protein|tara:strand:- start:4820 stop:5044 length:225 start_codon:yes stop_codon:yes gene_type:complete
MGIKVENQPNLERDEYSQAIINTNKSAYQIYMERRIKAEKSQDDIRNCVKEINSLKKDLKDIKSLLKGNLNNGA